MNCSMDQNDIQRGAEAQNAVGGTSTKDLNGADPLSVAKDNLAEAADLAATHDSSANDIVEAIKAGSGRDSTAAEQAEMAQIARGIRTKQDLIEQAKGSGQRVASVFQDLMSRLDGTTVGTAGSWLNICTAIKSRFLDSTAAFDDWVLRYFVDNRLDVQSQRLIQAKNLSIAARRSLQSQYAAKLNDICTRIGKPIADRLGMSVEEVMTLLGDAANAIYAPEGNARLRAKWAKQLNELEAKDKPTKKELSTMAQLRKNIARMDEYIDEADVEGAYDLNKAEAEAEGEKALKPLHWGYTNGQAKKVLEDLRRVGITDAEMDQASLEISSFFRFIRDERMARDLIPQEVIETWDEQSERYVPAFGKADAQSFSDFHSTNLSDPGHFSEANGRMSKPDNAWSNMIMSADKAAREIGNLDFGDALVTAYLADMKRMRADNTYKGSGLRMYDLKRLNGMSKRDVLAAYTDAVKGRGGIIARIPSIDADGNITGVRKVVMQFDPRFNETGENGSKISGHQLNEALNDAKGGGVHGSDNILQSATSLYGQMFTRFTPGFAIVNGFRDTMERAFHMMNRSVYTETGMEIGGAHLVPMYMANLGRAMHMLGQIMRGTAAEGSAAARYGEEYRSMGLFQDYNRRFRRNTTLSTEEILANGTKDSTARLLSKPEYSGLKSAIDATGGLKDAVIGRLDSMNDYFNNISSFCQYLTMREAGVSARDAASVTLEMMDLYQSGKYTNGLRWFYPFVRPTMQSAANMARTLGFTYDPRGVIKAGHKGWGASVGAFAIASMLLPVIREQMGTDDKGNYRFDALGSSVLSSSIPIGLSDGTYVKLPVGYGPMQVVMSLAVGADRMRRGVGNAQDMVGDVLFAWTRNMLPGNWPEFSFSQHPAEYLVHTLAPAWLQPAVEISTNISHFGTPITRASGEAQAKAYQGSIATPKFYHDMAKSVYSMFGVDLAPEQLKATAQGMLIGPLKLLRTYLDGDADMRRTKGAQSFAGLHPIFAAFGGTMMFGDNYNTGRSIFYNTYDRFQNEWKKAGLKLTSDDSSDYHRNKPEERHAFMEKQLREAGFDDDFIADWILLDDGQRAIYKLNQASNKDLKELFMTSNDSEDVRAKFRDLSEQYYDVFSEVAANLRIYRR